MTPWLTTGGEPKRLAHSRAIEAGRGGIAVRKLLLTASLAAALSFGLPAALQADPGGPNLQQPTALRCDNGMQLVVNTGTVTNRGRVAWDVNGTGVFVTAYLAVTNGTETEVLFDSKPGLKNLITCTGDVGGGFTVIATGFLTPR
jgi:hypothetical protein